MQFSYLFAECLALRVKMQPINAAALQLGAESLRIFIDKPSGWEYLVFAKLLDERIQSYNSKRLDAELEISFGEVNNFTDQEATISWMLKKFAQIKLLIEQIARAFNIGLNKAVGEPGEPGDINRIVHLASRIADGYAQILDWKLEFHRLVVTSELKKLMRLASNFSTNILSEIEIFARELYPRIDNAIQNHKPGEIIDFKLTLSVPNQEEFEEELQRLTKLYRSVM